ncbi:MMPL family transporter [Kamptonema cortianum]|nr:MMPL family transporter [Kamptonema cortianum]MDL5046183.1 MMPL family transporter [Oscillatoria amoena NRMC-F 0135]
MKPGIFRTLLQKTLESTARRIVRHPWTHIGFFAAFTLACIYLSVFQLGIVGNTNALIDSDDEIHKAWLSYLNDFNVSEDIVVVVQSPDRGKNREIVSELASVFRSRPDYIKNVYYRNDFSRIQEKALLFLSPGELEDVSQQTAQLAQAMRRTRSDLNVNFMLSEARKEFENLEKHKGKALEGFGKFVDDFTVKLDKLAVELERKPKVAKAQDDGSGQRREAALSEIEEEFAKKEYLEFDNGRMFIMLLTPQQNSDESFTPYSETISFIRRAVEEAEKTWPGAEFGVTGELVLLQDEMEMSTHDTMIASIFCFAIVAGIVFVSFRELIRPGLAVGVLGCIISWTLGTGALIVGHLNIISQAVIIMIIGHGIDFGIQIISRYEEEVSKGSNYADALVKAMGTTGMAIVTTGTINALAFYTMCFNSFVGLREMGILAGTGLILSVMGYLVFLPALLVIADRRKLHEPKTSNVFKPLGGARLERFFFARPWAWLSVFAAVSVLCIPLVRNMRFDYNLLNLQSPNTNAVKTLKALDSQAFSILFGVMTADSLEESRRKAEAVAALPTVKSVRGLHEMIPVGQEEKIPVIQAVKKQLAAVDLREKKQPDINVRQARSDIAALLKACQEGYEEARKYTGISGQAKQAVEIFTRLIAPLERAQKALESLSDQEVLRKLDDYDRDTVGRMRAGLRFIQQSNVTGPVTLEDIPGPLLKRFYSPQTGQFAIEIEPKENVWGQEESLRFVEDMRKIDPLATGTPVQNTVYIALLKDSFVEAGMMAIAAIIVLVWLHFKNLLRVALVIFPLFLAIFWTLGSMTLFDIPFNPANIVTLPLIIGLGMSFGVYIVDRYDEDGHVNIFLSSTGKAMFLTGITTIISFGCMIPGEYVGLSTLGMVMTIAMAFCLLTGLIVLPQLLIVMERMGLLKPRPTALQKS